MGKNNASYKEPILLPERLLLPFFDDKWSKNVGDVKNSIYEITTSTPKPNPRAEDFIAYLKSIRKGQVLDLGCGDGRFSIKCAKIGLEVIGIDFAPNAISRLEKRARANKVFHLVKGVVADIRTFDFGVRAYESIICSDVLHYFSDKEVKRIIERMKKTTTEGGLNYIALEADIEMTLPDGMRFKFENQPNRNTEKAKVMLNNLYRNWYILKKSVTRTIVPKAPLSTPVKKFLGVKADYYSRYFNSVEFIAKNK